MNMDVPHIILASGSPRRRELMTALQLPFEVIVSHADEEVEEGLSPTQIVESLALRKASSVRDTMEPDAAEAVIVGSDTIVVLDGEVLGKPVDHSEAVRMLTALQGRTHEVFTGVACLHTGNGMTRISSRRTLVTMKPLDEQSIRAYVATGEPADKAGAYGIQGLGATLVEAIEGCYFNVVGLPVSLLTDMLSEFGIHVLRPQ